MYTCPQLHHGITYYFKTACEIATCKNYTKRLPYRCLEIERVDSTTEENISPIEIAFFKELDGVKTVALQLSRTEAAITTGIILDAYVTFCTEYDSKYLNLARTHPDIVELSKRAIFRSGTITFPWDHLHVLTNNASYEKFIRSTKCKKCAGIPLYLLLGIQKPTLDAIHSYVLSLLR